MSLIFVFLGVPQALHASACLQHWLSILMLVPEGLALKLEKVPHSGHQVPKQLPIIFGRGRSKPSPRYLKGSRPPPLNPLPPKKQKQYFGTNPDTLSPKCFVHLVRFSGRPQTFGTTPKLRNKVVPKVSPFSLGVHQGEARDSLSEGARGCEHHRAQGVCPANPHRCESAMQRDFFEGH